MLKFYLTVGKIPKGYIYINWPEFSVWTEVVVRDVWDVDDFPADSVWLGGWLCAGFDDDIDVDILRAWTIYNKILTLTQVLGSKIV